MYVIRPVFGKVVDIALAGETALLCLLDFMVNSLVVIIMLLKLAIEVLLKLQILIFFLIIVQ